ncbi:signal recognition particle protein [Asticcacaulis sp. EMRT-3]|uniref:signal recognition particle protein n=1 Tax=Asticcacaulis sp. EMRT-3 TaxID=3040349 RepID=UPI0024AF5419|nr:signal recognition particle protein [Asticcacaulis sp. EMRT-3]MDI7775685.1 signal recognition particle protein [Asticcacaulis sp. EMRT-3]
MFDTLNERLSGLFDSLSGRGVLSEKDVEAALREVRVALLEADVALPVVRQFMTKAKELATGEAVIKAVRPADQVVKIVYDGLIDMLGGEEPEPINLNAVPPVVILMAGLQGSGKTTTSAKLALRLKNFDRKKVMMASLDTRRPAAMEQLKLLADQVGVEFLPIVTGQSAVEITRRALTSAKLQGFDVLILDTAGRTTLDDELMDEAAEIARIAKPTETFLVADSLTGQDAVRTATAFHERLPLTGLILTRADGDGRGGAMLSMRATTGLPIKYLGAGEKVDALDVFDARRIAGRILGQGDIVALVEKAAQELDAAQTAAMAKKMAKGQFDLDDLANQLRQMKKMGGMSGIMGLLPGVQKVKKQIDEMNISDKVFDRQVAIITSMTKTERKKPELLNASRKRRIAAGAGVEVQDINRLLKQHRQMADTFKMMARSNGRGPMGQMARMFGGGAMPGGGSMPGSMDDMAEMAKKMGQGAPGANPLTGLNPALDLEKLKNLGAGKSPGASPSSGLFGGLPGLPGAKPFNPTKK